MPISDVIGIEACLLLMCDNYNYHTLTMSKWFFWCDSSQFALAMWALDKD